LRPLKPSKHDRTIYVIFASIMRGAVRGGYIRKTPCVDIRLPEVGKTVVRLLKPAQIFALPTPCPRAMPSSSCSVPELAFGKVRPSASLSTVSTPQPR
jgi:hypothetical protein